MCQDKNASRSPERSVSRCPDSLVTLNINNNAKLSTDRSQSTSLSRSAVPYRIRLKDRSPDRFVTRFPDRLADKFQSQRQNTDLKLIVIPSLRRGVLKFQRRLAITIKCI